MVRVDEIARHVELDVGVAASGGGDVVEVVVLLRPPGGDLDRVLQGGLGDGMQGRRSMGMVANADAARGISWAELRRHPSEVELGRTEKGECAELTAGLEQVQAVGAALGEGQDEREVVAQHCMTPAKLVCTVHCAARGGRT